jgi:nitrogen-specific signal transduction histidine kinase
LNTVITISKRAVKIIENLIDFAGPHAPQRIKTDINKELDNLLKLIKPELIKKGIKIRKFFGSLPHFSCNLDQIAQVFLHLIANARDAMEETGGTLTIRTRKDRSNVEIFFQTWE